MKPTEVRITFEPTETEIEHHRVDAKLLRRVITITRDGIEFPTNKPYPREIELGQRVLAFLKTGKWDIE